MAADSLFIVDDGLQVKCPAGEEAHPVLSPNELDIECRIQGNLRPATEDGPCCGAYAECPAWIGHKQRQVENREVRVRQAMRARAHHVLPDRARETVRA